MQTWARDVIKIEPPGGDPVRSMPPFAGDQPGPDRSLRWLAYNSNKSSVVLDLTSAEGHDHLLEMARSSDVVLDSYEPGYLASISLSDAELRATNPRLITVSVTPFGESGPYGSYNGSDLHAMALSGLMTIQGDKRTAAHHRPAGSGVHPYLSPRRARRLLCADGPPQDGARPARRGLHA